VEEAKDLNPCKILAMRAFKVYLNGKKLCQAGIGDHGVLSAIVTWVAGDDGGDLFMEVGGLVSPIQEHVHWISQKPLSIGDEIQVKIVETASVDKPAKRKQTDPVEELNAQKRYVRMMAKRLGWTIQVPSRSLHPKRK
jgi:hypothetical protein